MLRLRICKPVDQALSRYRTDITDGRQFLFRGCGELIEAAKMCSKYFPGFCADLSDSKGIDQTAEVVPLALFNS